MARKLPASVTDYLMHEQNSDLTEKILLPITRYKNVLNAPQVVRSINSVKGAPFLLYQTETEELDTKQLRALVEDIV